MTATLGGREIRLAATFKASLEIAHHVADPLTIMREAALESMFFQRGMPYEPKWRFSITNILQILLIGMRAAGEKPKTEEIEELIFEAGFLEAKEVAAEYLSMINGPRPTEISDKETQEGN